MTSSYLHFPEFDPVIFSIGPVALHWYGLMYLVVILAGGLSLVYGRITAGDMVAYMLYVTTLIGHHPPHCGICRAVPAGHDRYRALFPDSWTPMWIFLMKKGLFL